MLLKLNINFFKVKFHKFLKREKVIISEMFIERLSESYGSIVTRFLSQFKISFIKVE